VCVGINVILNCCAREKRNFKDRNNISSRNKNNNNNNNNSDDENNGRADFDETRSESVVFEVAAVYAPAKGAILNLITI